jgi:hypothetical protein
VWYQITVIAYFPLGLATFILLGLQDHAPLPCLVALWIGSVFLNQWLFYRAATLGGSSFTLLSGPATKAGRACWRAAGDYGERPQAASH